MSKPALRSVNSRSNQQGFSLIELMVVVVIIGLGVGMLAVNVGSGGNKLRNEARQFANMTALVAEEAVMGRRQWGVDIYRELDDAGLQRFAYRWLSLDGDAGWRPVAPDEMEESFNFSSDVGLVLEVEGIEKTIDEKKPFVEPKQNEDGSAAESTNALKPDIYLYSSGELSAFRLQLVDQVDPDVYQWVKGDILGRIKLEKGDPDEY